MLNSFSFNDSLILLSHTSYAVLNAQGVLKVRQVRDNDEHLPLQLLCVRMFPVCFLCAVPAGSGPLGPPRVPTRPSHPHAPTRTKQGAQVSPPSFRRTRAIAVHSAGLVRIMGPEFVK